MLEIKLTISLDERTTETIEKIIGAMNREVTLKVADAEEPKKKAEAPIKATAAPIEEAETETRKPAAKATVTPQDEPQQVEKDEPEKDTTPDEKPAEQPKKDITIEELRTLLASAKREKGTDAIKAILKGYGVSLLSDLDPSHYAEVAKKVREL